MADNQNIIKCPACGTEMTKVYMNEQGINLDVCVNGCGGIFFDNREFKQFDEQHESIDEVVEALKDKTFVEVDQTQTRVCPACGSNMVKNFSSVKAKIEVDECYFCGGKFLDNGELIKIRDEYATEAERSADLAKVITVHGNSLEYSQTSPAKILFESLFRKIK
ncbi:MAG: zf-TFIIB domain-containing protein [Fusobacterium sp.]|nr:zf-TFIIB domain-containing protein [Fusobacterium sp.]